MDLIVRGTAQADKIKKLVESSFALRFDDLEATLDHSSLAIALVEKASDRLPDEVVAEAWTQYGNALRLAGRFREAESALARAGTFAISHLPARIHLLEVRSSLDRNTGRYESAASCLTEALATQQSLVDPVGLARIYNLLGLVYSESGESTRALRAFQTALSYLGQGAPRDILATTAHNLFHNLLENGKLEAAEAALTSLEPFYRQFTAARLAAKCAWLRARYFRRLGHRSAAGVLYKHADVLLRTASPGSAELAQLVQEMAGV